MSRRADPLEREADRVAADVTRTGEPSPDRAQARPGRVADGPGGPGGAPLSSAERAYFEPRFGHDFSRVRVHASGQAAEAARHEGARAFTRGHDIVFGAGQYAPDTPEGKRVLAHELAHVVQQSGGGQALPGSAPISSAPPGRIQRWDWSDVVDVLQWTNPLTFSQKALRTVTGAEINLPFAAEQTVRLSATRISIPDDHIATLKRYAQAVPGDGAILNDALDQEPRFYKGGWLLAVQGDAEAITFGNSIFFNDSPPTVETFVHEMVHIHQYHHLGRVAFLASYFGTSLATILWRLAHREPIQVMKSSPHEVAAYNLEKRFAAWLATHP